MASLMYVKQDKSKAIIFNYLVNYRQRLQTSVEPIKLNGLDPGKKYQIKEINLYPGSRSWLNAEKVYSGDFLMKVGFNPLVNLNRTSVVLEVNEVR
jgi:alpha-galactosidase